MRNLATPDPAPAAKSPAAGSATGSNAPAAAPLALPSAEGVDFRVLTLPVVVAALFGGGVAWYILDPGFRLLLKEGALKDSNEYAGYEKELKEGRLPNSRVSVGWGGMGGLEMPGWGQHAVAHMHWGSGWARRLSDLPPTSHQVTRVFPTIPLHRASTRPRCRLGR